MAQRALHRFEQGGRKFVVDPETCFCFECDEISWEVVARYPHTPINRIYHELEARFPRSELEEVVGEIEWLRACKSILPPVNHEALQNHFQLQRGVRQLTVELPADGELGGHVRQAATLLFSRARDQASVRLDLRCDLEALSRAPEALARACTDTLRMAALADKLLSLVFQVALLPGPADKCLHGHDVALLVHLQRGAEVASALEALRGASRGRLAKVVKRFAELPATRLGVRIVPGTPDFSDAIAALIGAGFDEVHLDIDAAYVAHPELSPEAILDGLRSAAVQYAQDLLKGRYYRLEPMAGIFKRIYDGTPLPRADLAGVQELAIDAVGRLYPAALFLGQERFCIGNLASGDIDATALALFDDVGALTTPECIRCWGRNFCGGGTAAVHQALSGHFRRPHPGWCEAQRDWTASAIAAFNVLSSNGVNFTRIHAGLGRASGKPSWATLARAAFRMQLGIRNIEERDAPWLQRWENWNPAAYFALHESGMLMATRYDREMDSLHPHAYEHEFVVVRRNGTPCGLLRVRPERLPGLATVWLYLRDAKDYASPAVRKSFRALLEEASKQQAVATIVTPVGPFDTGLSAFLAATGYTYVGKAREAFYLHGAHHDTEVYALRF